MSFADLQLRSELLTTLLEAGYEQPTLIQRNAIPAILSGQDVMAAAQTGTGKTAGFTLPILHNLSTGKSARHNQVRALILTPTRELAAQVFESVQTYGKHLSLSAAVVFGGVKINPQMMKLRGGVDILVATPGRLLDLAGQNAVKFDQLDVLVLDEADRMLDMGFIRDIRKILALLPSKRQNLMFSATFSDEIRELAKTIVHDPVEISVSPANSTKAEIEHWVYPVDKTRKTALLIELIESQQWHQVLVFSRTKHGANRITKKLEASGIKAAAIHGNKSQGARTRALAEFKANDIQALVATDIAARGIDIDQLPQVVNFDLPNVAEDYVHRIGRTGRAGATGQAVSLVSGDEAKLLFAIERLIGRVIDREIFPGSAPTVALPEFRPPKPPKKHRPKNRKLINRQQADAGAEGAAPSNKSHRAKSPRHPNTLPKGTSSSGSRKPAGKGNSDKNSGNGNAKSYNRRRRNSRASGNNPRSVEHRPDNFGNR